MDPFMCLYKAMDMSPYIISSATYLSLITCSVCASMSETDYVNVAMS